MPTTSGSPSLSQHRPQRHADAVQSLVDAGAIIFGKTNLPLYAGDWQSYNDVYGTTNNPWDTSKTPGGSSGGAAAALAAGLTPLELGSDIGGSIRTPAHYCGVYGHKPTHDIISLRGHIPGPPGTMAQPDLAVAGPLALTAADLKLALDILTGPQRNRSLGRRLLLPPPTVTELKSLRIAYWFDDPRCPIDSQMRALYQQMIDALRAAGATVQAARPAGLTLDDILAFYMPLLASVIGAGVPQKLYRRLPIMARSLRLMRRVRDEIPADAPDYLEDMALSHRRWLGANEARMKAQHKVADFFEQVDVLLMPIVPTTAQPHNQAGEIIMRTMQVNGESRPYGDHFPWIALATALGLPATSAPVGFVDGLPANVQIVAPQFNDYNTIAFAKLLQTVIGGFVPPKG